MTTQTHALDFCRKIEVWQKSPDATSGLPLGLPDGELAGLSSLLHEAWTAGTSPALEARARLWLIGYAALEEGQRTLTDDQRAELAAITGTAQLALPVPVVMPVRRHGMPARQVFRLAWLVFWAGFWACYLLSVLSR